MEAQLKANLRILCEIFTAAAALAAGTVWARAVGDARFLDRIDSGRGFTVKTYDNAVAWFSAHWPAGAEWPASIDRPSSPDDEGRA